MAITKVTFFSEALMRYVNFEAVIPIDKRSVDGEHRRSPEKPMKSLYLLHGVYGSELDFITRSRIALWAQERNLAVFFPAGENKFYSDLDATHDRFSQYIGDDLVDFTRTMFRLSTKKEDTYIGGISMGGMGAIEAALKYPETFGMVGALSSALVMEKYPKGNAEVGLKDDRRILETIFGPEEEYPGSENDYYALAEKLAASGKELPKFYMACGLQDGLIGFNYKYRDHLLKLGYDVTWNEQDGAHEWIFWDKELFNLLNWLPLENPKDMDEKI